MDPADDLGAPVSHTGRVVARGRRGFTVRAEGANGPVAIKAARYPLDGDRTKRGFERAAADLAQLSSPCLTPPIHWGVSADDRPWVVVPWEVGGSLAQRLDQSGPLGIDDVLGAARDMALGLSSLARAGIVHGNLTPGNLLAGRERILLDGVALPGLGPHWDGPEAPSDVPPEVVEGGEWTAQGDVWSWASVVHTLLHGRPPWAAAAHGGRSSWLLAIATGERPGGSRSDVPRDLAELLSDCLRIDAGDRPSGPAEVLDELGTMRNRRPAPETAARRRADTLPEDRLDTLPPPKPVPDEPVGRPIGSSYVLLEPLGAGATGQVWRGERRQDHTAVAIKVLKPELTTDPDQVARFLRERTTLVSLVHPNLVPVLDMVAEGQTLAIVMGLVDGADLRRALAERPTLAAAEVCWLLAQIVAGVEAMHETGIVHRDIKPENVLVETAPDGSGVARLTDYGLARTLTGPALTRTTQLVGTVDYLAPELVAGRALSPAADLYSLGVMAYELLSGYRPFSGEHPAAILQAHLDGLVSRPPGLPDEVWALVRRCLEKDPAARPTAAVLRNELLEVAPRVTNAPALDPAAWRPPGPSEAVSEARAAGVPPVAMEPPPSELPTPSGETELPWRPPTLPDGRDPIPAPAPGAAPALLPPDATSGVPTVVTASSLVPPERQPKAPEPAKPPELPSFDDRVATSTGLPPLRRNYEPPKPLSTDSATKRRKWVPVVAVLVVLILAGAGGGVALALNHHQKVVTLYRQDVTASVKADGTGDVTITGTGVAGAQYYALYQSDGPTGLFKLRTPQPTSIESNQTATVQLNPKTMPACFRIDAYVPTKPTDPGAFDPTKDCVNSQ